ncbi:MAG TPA: glycoside hydrolase family 15 protein [Geobacteraceae bacterium]|nr:glycoside hydrolase family 15 protein [Geobacteraceae bacterium]
MPRDIPVGNGTLLVCFDRDYAIRDLYFPHVGQENHTGGSRSRCGVWADGRFAWVGPGWDMDLRYETDTLVSRVRLLHREMGLLLLCRDAVDFHENIFVREVVVENMRPEEREVRLFFAQDFSISGNNVGDTAAFDPETGGVMHYKRSRYFLANAAIPGKCGLSQFAVGQKETAGREGTWRDAEDGILSGNPIAQGSVDSVIGITITIPAVSRGTVFYWLAAGKDRPGVARLDSLVKHKGADGLIRRTADYWTLWGHKETPSMEGLPDNVAELYRRSLLLLHTQIDAAGGILAANDSDVIQFNRDTYSYIWPRDGALAANALDLAGYPAAARGFYGFIAGLSRPEGYLLHKYNPDGTPASSWLPWFADGEPQLPIQEDETALVLWALWHHFVLYRDIEFVKPLYRPLIKNAADFMCAYRDGRTGLPAPSYDLWEERRGILSFTVGAVFGGLTAASLFCTVFGETKRADHYRRVAAEIRDAASTHLWREELGRFCRMISYNGENEPVVDGACDASLWGLFAFGLYDAADPRIAATFAALRERLWINTPIGGMARYEVDEFYRADAGLPGNPWFIATLWLADYLVSRAGDEREMAEAIDILGWVAGHALPSGVLAEQVHPLTGAPLSVSPLTWSHATFVATVQRLVRRRARMLECPTCGLPMTAERSSVDWLEKMFGEACDAIHGICEV